MEAGEKQLQQITRRHFFSQCALGVGSIALASMMGGSAGAAEMDANPLAPKKTKASLRSGAPANSYFLSTWPPKASRMADSTRFWKSSSPRILLSSCRSPRTRKNPSRSPPCGSRKTGSKLSISPSSWSCRSPWCSGRLSATCWVV